MHTPDNAVKYMRRFPTKCSRDMNVIVANTFKKLKIAVATSGGNGLLYALKIFIKYGVIAKIPENWRMMNNAATMKSGLIVRFSLNSANFSVNGGVECVHFWFFSMQVLHDLERSLNFWISRNSSAIISLGTQPRNQHRALSASSTLFLDRSQWGVSGTWSKQFDSRKISQQRERLKEENQNRWTYKVECYHR